MPGGTALFGSAASRGQTKNLVEFKAGKMTLKDKMVHPDKRKGLVYIYQSDDSLMHFCWKDRSNNSVEEDLIIFPDDVEFKKVPQCTTGRVYMLKFKSSSRIFFFWLQEPKTDKDEDNCRKVNEILNNPPALGSQRSGGATPDGDLQNLLSNMSQQQLMQLFGGVSGGIGGLSSLLGTMNSPRSSSGTAASTGPPSVASTPATSTPSSATAAAKTPVTPANPIPKPARPAAPVKAASSASSVGDRDNLIQLSQLQNYFIQNFENSSQASTDTASGVDLSTSVNQESLQAILNNPAFVRELQRHLPAFGDSGHEDLRSTLASPQFQQALSMFSTALQSGQLGPVVSQFQVGNDAVVAANQGNMEEFVRALQAASISSLQVKDDDKETKQDEKKPKKDEEEDMNLD